MTGIMDSAWQFVIDKLYGIWQPILEFAYLAGWFAFGGVIMLLAVIVSYFLPFTWVRVVSGWVFSNVVVGLVAGTVMFRYMRSQEQAQKARERAQQQTRPKQEDKWRFPF